MIMVNETYNYHYTIRMLHHKSRETSLFIHVCYELKKLKQKLQILFNLGEKYVPYDDDLISNSAKWSLVFNLTNIPEPKKGTLNIPQSYENKKKLIDAYNGY